MWNVDGAMQKEFATHKVIANGSEKSQNALDSYYMKMENRGYRTTLM